MGAPPYRSVAESVVWPAAPHPVGGAVMGLLFQLEQTQWWSPEKLRAQQFRQLGLLAEHALKTVPHYRQTRKPFTGPMTSEIWRSLPILKRDEVQSAGDALNSEALPKSHGKTQEIFTSGSTGKPVSVLRTQLSMNYWAAFTVRDHLWQRRDMTGKLAAIRDSTKGKALYPKGESGERWGWVSALMFDTGPLVTLNITSPVEQQLEWLQRENPDYLLSFPTMLHSLAALSLESGVRLPALKQITTISEALRPATRDICHDAWGVSIADMYTTREIGYIALQCPEHEHYHVQSEATFVEVLNEAGEPCAPGETGRVIVTPLHNFATPLLRYDVGDYAEVGAPCPCGRGLPVLNRIMGREQNMLMMPGGKKRWVLFSSNDIRSFLTLAPIRQYQLVQKTIDTIELRLAVARPLEATEEDALRDWVQKKFAHPFQVTLTYLDEIPRTASGKFHDFISEVE